MPVTDLLIRNAREHGDEVALVELNPGMEDPRKMSFKEFELVQQTQPHPFRHEITWQVFNEKANRVANMLIAGGIEKGDRVAILMFNCLEWLPQGNSAQTSESVSGGRDGGGSSPHRERRLLPLHSASIIPVRSSTGWVLCGPAARLCS